MDLNKLQKILANPGLDVSIGLTLVIDLIRKNLILLSNLNYNQINEVSNINQHPIKNEEAIKKKIKASYIFTDKDSFKKCGLLLNNCETLNLDTKELRKALKQDLNDLNGNDLIFLGDLEKFSKTQDMIKSKLIIIKIIYFLLKI